MKGGNDMRKDSYRIIFEEAFDDALYHATVFNSCATLSNDSSLIGATQHVLLFRMLIMAYETGSTSNYVVFRNEQERSLQMA